MDRWIPQSHCVAGRHVVVTAGTLLVDGRAYRVDGRTRIEIAAESPPVFLYLLLLALAAVGLPVVQALLVAGALDAPGLVAGPAALGVFATVGLLTGATRYGVVLRRGDERRRLLTSDDAESAKLVESLLREAIALDDAAAR